MKKFTSFLMIATLLIIALSGCRSAEKSKEINLYTWEAYVPAEVINEFTAKTGIQVNYSTFNDNDEMLAKIQTQGDLYDIILCTDYAIDIMIREGNTLQKLDKSKLPNFKNIDPAFLGKYYDLESEYAIPYAFAAALLVYDSAKITDKIEGYEDLWNPNFKDQIASLNSIRDNLGFTLMTMNKSINETDPVVLNEAKEKLLNLKPNIIAFASSTPDEALISKEATIGYMFGSQATEVIKAIPTAKYVYPKEGFIVSTDNFVMTKNAPNKENALEFLNYLMDGEVSAKASLLINYTNTNTAAQAFLPQEFLDNKVINIPTEILFDASSQMYQDVGETMVIYDEIWTEFKSR